MVVIVHFALPYTYQVKEFIDCISGPSSLYGLQQETLDSLVLMLLPPLTHKYESLGEPSVMDSGLDLKVAADAGAASEPPPLCWLLYPPGE